MKRIILFGAPGSGKGTQADALEEKYGYKKIATGDLVRTEIAEKTELGMQFKYISGKGELVPDDVIVRMFKKRLGQKDIKNAYIVDGFPRTLSQAEALSGIEADEEIAVYLKLGDEDLVVKRILSRLTCTQCGAIYRTEGDPPANEVKCTRCGGIAERRSDDTEDVVRRRIHVYREATKPVIRYYKDRGVFHEIDASRTIEEIFKDLEDVLN